MDEKMEEVLKGIYNSLTDEQKQMAKACKTVEELAALAGREGIELPDEALDAVAGGCGGGRAPGDTRPTSTSSTPLRLAHHLR